MQIDIHKLYEKYLTLNIPNPFSLDDIHRRLTEKYYAEKVDLNFFSALSRDPDADFNNAVTAYVFRDERGIRELVKLNKEEDIDDTMEFGLVINSTQIGVSFVLTLEICIFDGIEADEIHLGNLRFEEYLIALYLTGYIQFDNDSEIDLLVERYRDGYYFRNFGAYNGQEMYLYK
ncbi:pyruvate kinase [Paenibacillus amylolyticus]|uniref:pyruvate kinase n=1 Tax=Paenibacillus amylolyticus TaxID=1451 RepID=UPI00201DC569|nr:pyruvate kinase [Paenibacillus amylolyticus]MCL6664185.1 pyruvate kinase [Paenibacillus amylolyticus]